MTAQPLDFHSPARVLEETPFMLDDEPMVAIKPKGGQLLSLAKDIRLMADTDPLAQTEIIDRFMAMCMTPDSSRRITERLEDPDDDFDVDTLTVIIQRLQEVWTDRPTTPSPGSSRRRGTTGRGSTGRVPSRA